MTWLDKLNFFLEEMKTIQPNKGPYQKPSVEHPLDWKKDSINPFINDEHSLSTIQTEGMIIDIKLKISRKGFFYYLLTIASPFKISIWRINNELRKDIDISDNQKIKNGQPPLWRLGTIVRIKGNLDERAYASNFAAEIKDITPYAYLHENYTKEELQEHMIDLYANAKSILIKYFSAIKEEDILRKNLRKDYEKKHAQKKAKEAKHKLMKQMNKLKETK